jgi:hypothetical protein
MKKKLPAMIFMAVCALFYRGVANANGPIYCVGENGTLLTLGSDGWHAIATGPETPIPEGNYTGIWGSGDNDIYIAYGSNDLIHYEGGEWSVYSTGAPGDIGFKDVYGNSADEIVALGYSLYPPLRGTASPSQIYTCVFKFDGVMWDLWGDCIFEPVSCVLASNGDFFASGYE